MNIVVVIPIGPGHEEVAKKAVASVHAAWATTQGPFTEMVVCTGEDPEGRYGRSAIRNKGLSIPADWHFLLDADDQMMPRAFDLVDLDKPATFGAVCLDGLIPSSNQTTVTRETLFRLGAKGTLSMGCFLRGDLGLLFDEQLDVGEDFDFYMRLPGWRKRPDPLVSIGYWKTASAGGPRSSAGVKWTEACRAVIERYRLKVHTLPRPEGLEEVVTVLDVGAGIRPMNWYAPQRHVCVEPFAPYAKVLRAARYPVRQATALDALRFYLITPEERQLTPDAVYLLDVIEHMEKAEGAQVIQMACRLARRQVLVYTPFGFVKQTEDAWGMGGEYWQTHRSGWLPTDFPGWQIQLFQPPPKRTPDGFFALCTKG